MQIRAIAMASFLAFAPWLIATAKAQEVKLADLVSEALLRSPEILAAQKNYEASRQRPSQAASLPDPVFSPAWNSNGNPLPGAGIGREPTSNIGFAVTQSIPWAGKRRLRGDVARKEADVQFTQFELVQLSVISRIKQAFFRLQHSWAQRALLERNRDFLKTLLEATEVRYAAGGAAQQDVFRAQTQLSLVEVRLLQNDREQRLREAEINSLRNRPTGTRLGEPEEPHAVPLTLTIEQLQDAARAGAPTRQRDQKMAERANLAVNLARKDYYPDYAVSGGYYNMAGLPAFYSFRVDINVPLWFRTKQRAALTEQAIGAVQARRAYEAAGQSLDLRIADDYYSAGSSLKLMGLYLDTVIPQARLAADSSLASYQTGAVDFLSLLNAYNSVLDYEMNYHEEMLSYHLALARLEETTGLGLIEDDTVNHEGHLQ